MGFMKINLRTNSFILMLCIACFSLPIGPQPKFQCDKSLFLTSKNKVCYDKNCVSETNVFVNLVMGKNICLWTVSGILTQIKLYSLFKVLIYKPYYQTSSFILNVKSHSRCKHAGYCSAEYCTPDRLHDITGDPKPSGLTPVYGLTGCIHSGLGCSKWSCGLSGQGVCTWGLYEIIPKYPFLNVYILESYTWSGILQYKYANLTTLNIEIGEANLLINEPLTMAIHSMISQQFHLNTKDNYGIELMKNEFLNIEVSGLNQPVSGTIGDIQLQLNNNSTFVYPLQDIQCDVQGCIMQCSTPPATIDRILTPENKKKWVEANLISSPIYNPSGSLHIMKPIQGSVSITFLSPEIDSLIYFNPGCKFQVSYTLGCEACDRSSVVIIQAYNIETPGILQITSNCSLTQNYISCQKNIQQLEITKTPSYCEIQIMNNQHSQKIKQAENNTLLEGIDFITFKINYIFVGGVDAIHLVTYTSSPANFKDDALLLLNNNMFKWGIGITFATVTIFFTVLRIILLSVATLKSKKYIEKQTEPKI